MAIMSPTQFQMASEALATDYALKDAAPLTSFRNANVPVRQALALIAAAHANTIRMTLRMVPAGADRDELLQMVRLLCDPQTPDRCS